MFVVPKHTAHKMGITSNSVLQKICINLDILQFKTNQTKNSKNDKKWEIVPFWEQKLLKMIFLTLN